ncbi:RsfA family transcriptional regulator [Niallia sp. Man26]|uniref:RsfA family transcriptional regulator n=1 Tax=Niallia sp. Man26 TaxID=2912824 RepID=UPI001EDC864D|nr:RsfA family transcriptional regulator [Niallia sp. Man26]UPO91010.1 RsfA family transcriptional regulator [Niallia sp. Man26]
MTSTRQDAWKEEEDKLLVDVVLRLIKEGGTQLQAFEEVGRELSRSSAACGFRWNSFLRKQYKDDITIAKNHRKQLKKGVLITIEKPILEEKEEQLPASAIKDDDEFEQIIQYLKVINKKALELHKVEEFEKTISDLLTENKKLQKELSELNTSHKDLLSLMEKAREMVLFERRN